MEYVVARGISPSKPALRGDMRRVANLSLAGLVIAAALSGPVSAEPASSPSDYDREIAAAMARMHDAMNLPPTGDPDRDFAAAMIPHHQGAIDMARAVLAHGGDRVLRRLAQKIIVEQAQEIEVMRRALAAMPPPPDASGAVGTSSHQHAHPQPQSPRP